MTTPTNTDAADPSAEKPVPKTVSSQSLKAMSENLLGVINQRFNEHNEWMQQWYNWANSVMMQMQPIPPQAVMDFDMQSQRLISFVQSFKPTAELLQSSGHPKLATLIKNTEEGAKKAQESFQAAQKTVAQGNFNTQQNIWKLNKQTNQEILSMQQDTQRNRQASFDRSNKAFLDALRS